MKHKGLAAVWLTVGLVFLPFAASAIETLPGHCPPSGLSVEQLEEIKANEFQSGPQFSADEFAMILSACLGSPESALRDGIAYEGLVALLRGERISDQRKRDLLELYVSMLAPEVGDGQGFMKPFVALALAEVARTDRISAYLSPSERQMLVDAGAAYLRSIDDYRGFNDAEGWRHGVAHTADLLMQLALNENINVEQHRTILGAIAVQVSPAGHFYVYGEPARLARPVLFIAARGTLTEDEWTTWLARLASPAPLERWADAFSSNSGLAKRHNTSAFFSAIYLNASMTEQENIKRLLPGTIEAVRNLP